MVKGALTVCAYARFSRNRSVDRRGPAAWAALEETRDAQGNHLGAPPTPRLCIHATWWPIEYWARFTAPHSTLTGPPGLLRHPRASPGSGSATRRIGGGGFTSRTRLGSAGSGWRSQSLESLELPCGRGHELVFPEYQKPGKRIVIPTEHSPPPADPTAKPRSRRGRS